jgi:heptosyltransferase-2
VLLGVGGRLGDAILASTTISALQRLVPDARIGVLSPSAGRLILQSHPDVARLHVLDHWAVSLPDSHTPAEVIRHAREKRRVVRELREATYDVAFDLYPFFPNWSRVMHAADIPVRVGFTSAGFGALYTHPVEYQEHGDHAIVHQVRLLASHLGIDVTDVPALVPPPQGRAAPSAGHIVVHIAGATSEREWPEDRWRTLLSELTRDGTRVKCTGLAGREAELTERVIRGLAHCENLCGSLDWPAFVRVVREADAVISVDTATVHLAAAAGVPVVALTAGIGCIPNFRPYSNRGVALSHPVPCAPCYRRNGCDDMTCLRGITADDALGALRTVWA